MVPNIQKKTKVLEHNTFKLFYTIVDMNLFIYTLLRLDKLR